MLKYIYFLSLTHILVFANQCEKHDDYLSNTYECGFDFNVTFSKSCEFFPQFPQYVDGVYGIYSYSDKVDGYVNDCCNKSLAKKESCKLPPHSNDTTHYVFVKNKYCHLVILRDIDSDEHLKQRIINIGRLKKYCYFELPDGIHHSVSLKNATSDSNRHVEINSDWKYNKRAVIDQMCPDLQMETGSVRTTVLLEDSEELNCTEIETEDGILELLSKHMTSAVDSAHCLYVHSKEGFECLLPVPSQKVYEDFNVIVIVLPLIGFIIAVFVTMICCFRHIIWKKLRWFFCLENNSGKKLDEIIHIGDDDAEIAHKFFHEDDIEKPYKIEFDSNYSDFPKGHLGNGSKAEQSYNGTSLVINISEQEMTTKDQRRIDDENAYVQQQDIEAGVVSLNHVGDDYARKEMVLWGVSGLNESMVYTDSNYVGKELISREDPDTDSKDIVPGGQHISCTSTADSGIMTNGSVEESSYSQTDRAVFSIVVPSKEYDCCFDEVADIGQRDEYVDKRFLFHSVSGTDGGCDTSHSTNA